ncbi:MAG: transporter [Planctomycetaceae bacterium]
MRAISTAVTVFLLSTAALLAAEPQRRFVPVRSLDLGVELWPDELPEHGEYQLVPPKQAFGPPESEPRKTLFQWSYGTSFEGGINLEEEPLATDRPDFVEASTTVGKGVLQIESGYTYVRNKDAGDNSVTHNIGEVLFRYGVLQDWIELRLGVFPFSQVVGNPSPAVTNSGLEDLYLGAKIGLTPQEGWWPEMSIVPQMTVPTGANSVTSNKWLPGINWLYGWDVNDFISVGGSTQFNGAVDGQTSHKYTEWAQALTVGYALTDDIGAYTEWFALFPSGADSERVQHYIDGGFTYRPTPDMQFDIRAGLGLTNAADDYFVGSGFSIRIK